MESVERRDSSGSLAGPATNLSHGAGTLPTLNFESNQAVTRKTYNFCANFFSVFFFAYLTMVGRINGILFYWIDNTSYMHMSLKYSPHVFKGAEMTPDERIGKKKLGFASNRPILYRTSNIFAHSLNFALSLKWSERKFLNCDALYDFMQSWIH